MSGAEHIPVLLEEVVDVLDPSRPGLYLDGTLGLGGHAGAILARHPGARLIGFDLDESALAEARLRLRPYSDRVELFQGDFRRLLETDIAWPEVRGVLLDLGMSSYQLDDPSRGFSHTLDGPLDMRMDRRLHLTAARILDRYSEPKLAEMFRKYGELKGASRLARIIVNRRRMQRIESTVQLRLLVEETFRWFPQRGKTHPASKVFQALRIEVNSELEGLETFLDGLLDQLPSGGRLAVISFHSLEDRIVKHVFVRRARPGDGRPSITLLTKKPLTPSDEEISRNSRSRSAKLRAAEKLAHGS